MDILSQTQPYECVNCPPKMECCWLRNTAIWLKIMNSEIGPPRNDHPNLTVWALKPHRLGGLLIPLVNVYKKELERSTIFFLGKSTISTGPWLPVRFFLTFTRPGAGPQPLQPRHPAQRSAARRALRDSPSCSLASVFSETCRYQGLKKMAQSQ